MQDAEEGRTNGTDDFGSPGEKAPNGFDKIVANAGRREAR